MSAAPHFSLGSATPRVVASGIFTGAFAIPTIDDGPPSIEAISSSNINVGGQTIDISDQSAVVRGIGLVRSMDDLRNTMLTQQNGLAIRVVDVATVSVGSQPRLGIVGKDNDDDIVQGIVLMRRGEKSLPTIQRVSEEIDKINSSDILPPGVEIKPIYDRRGLINVTTHTVLHNMVVGIVLVFLFQWLFLGNLTSAVIVASTIPFALASFILSADAVAEPPAPLSARMTREEVLEILGAPEYERLERNSVRCLAYRTRLSDPRFPKPLIPRDGLVGAMQRGMLVGAEYVLYSEISESCSRMASTWDHPPDGYTCFRKFWLGC